ncbi:MULTISPECIES: hypothetical protein [unclassified Streptomyces]|uniref:hypothetical protein n=1 Tax=unclassified Streptomyces TaxID=2593676 RepID=UPI000AC5ACC7|nr:hypothetical protein [Streptomyces sp. NRRL S-1448]
MLDDTFASRLEGLGGLSEENAGRIEGLASPVLATPALAFIGGAAVVTGAYAAGQAVG